MKFQFPVKLRLYAPTIFAKYQLGIESNVVVFPALSQASFPEALFLMTMNMQKKLDFYNCALKNLNRKLCEFICVTIFQEILK